MLPKIPPTFDIEFQNKIAQKPNLEWISTPASANSFGISCKIIAITVLIIVFGFLDEKTTPIAIPSIIL